MTAGPTPKRSWPCRLVVRAAAGFLARTGAGAVGLSSVLLTLMAFGGTALVSDHAVLVHNRNVLQTAAAAASIAATQHLAKLDTRLTDEELSAELEPLARRYVLVNLPEHARGSLEDSLRVTITPDREAGIVSVEASADLGGAIVGRYFWGKLVEETSAASGALRVVVPVELVLAIDVTGSMSNSIYHHGNPYPEENRRISVVRNAAQVLVAALYDQHGGDTGHVSVGLVPFNTTVNVGASRQDWVSDLGQGHKVIPAGFGAWRGCIEHRQQQDDLDLSLVTPDQAPFTSWFWPSSREYRPDERADSDARTGRERLVRRQPSPELSTQPALRLPACRDHPPYHRPQQGRGSHRGSSTLGGRGHHDASRRGLGKASVGSRMA